MAFVAPLAAVAGIAGAGVSALGTISGGEAQSANASYQAQVALNNQTIADQNANYAVEAGEVSASNQSLKNAAQFGRLKTSMAANGVDINSGSAVDVEKSARIEGDTAAATTLSNAELQAYGYRTQAANFGAEAGLETTEAGEATTGAEIGAAGGLLSSASGVASKWPSIFGSSSSTSYPTVAQDQQNQ